MISIRTAKFKKVRTYQVMYKMTLPKGFGPGGRRVEGGGSRDDVEKMIGRRVENFKGILVLGFALCWAATDWRCLCRRDCLSLGVSPAKWTICPICAYCY